MTEAAVFIVASALAVAAASFVSYDSEDKWQRFALGVILLSALVSGGARLIGTFDFSVSDSSELPEGTGDLMPEVAREALASGVRAYIARELSLDEEDVEVELSGFELEKMSADSVTVTLSGAAAFCDYKTVERLVEDEGFGECEVILSFD